MSKTKHFISMLLLWLILLSIWVMVWYTTFYDTLIQQSVERKAMIEKRQIDIASMAEFYRQSIKSLQIEYSTIQQEKNALDIIIGTWAVNTTLPIAVEPVDYKKERANDLASYARSIGVDDIKIPYMIAWFITENWALSEDTIWDWWKSIWLCQCHVWYRKNCAKKWDYEAQKIQCVQWFKAYTIDSTIDTILKDIRAWHNSASKGYEWSIKANLQNLLLTYQ